MFAQRRVTIGQAAREAVVEHEEFDDALGVDPSGIERAIGAITRNRTQDRIPLTRVEARADVRERGQQQVIFDVENARDGIGALDKGAGTREMETFITQHRPGHRAQAARRRCRHAPDLVRRMGGRSLRPVPAGQPHLHRPSPRPGASAPCQRHWSRPTRSATPLYSRPWARCTSPMRVGSLSVFAVRRSSDRRLRERVFAHEGVARRGFLACYGLRTFALHPMTRCPCNGTVREPSVSLKGCRTAAASVRMLAN